MSISTLGTEIVSHRNLLTLFSPSFPIAHELFLNVTTSPAAKLRRNR
jgi:hypothetical protein